MSELGQQENMKGIGIQIERYRIRAHRRMRGHYLASQVAAGLHRRLGVAVIVSTAIVGTSIFASLSKKPEVFLTLATGALTLIAGVLSSLQTFFKFSESAAHHNEAAAEYGSVFRSLGFLKLTLGATEVPIQAALEKLEVSLRRIDELERTSPGIPDRLYDKAVAEQAADIEGI